MNAKELRAKAINNPDHETWRSKHAFYGSMVECRVNYDWHYEGRIVSTTYFIGADRVSAAAVDKYISENY